MIVKTLYSELLKPGIAWYFFIFYYPKRKKNENGSRYYRKRKKKYEEWCAERAKNQEAREIE